MMTIDTTDHHPATCPLSIMMAAPRKIEAPNK